MFLIVLVLVKFPPYLFTVLVLTLSLPLTNYEFVMYDLDDELSIDIHSEVFDKDFDEVGFEPVEIDDSDEELARTFGY